MDGKVSTKHAGLDLESIAPAISPGRRVVDQLVKGSFKIHRDMHLVRQDTLLGDGLRRSSERLP